MKPEPGLCVSAARNPSGGWDAVYVAGRDRLKEILVRSKGAAQVRIREHRTEQETVLASAH